MATVYLGGGETGDLLEINNASTGLSIDSSFKRSGAYSYKFDTASSSTIVFVLASAIGRLRLRGACAVDITTSPASELCYNLARFMSGTTTRATLWLVQKTAGTWWLRISVGFTETSTAETQLTALSADTWYQFEVDFDDASDTVTAYWGTDSATSLTSTTQATNAGFTGTVDRIRSGYISQGGVGPQSGRVWWLDDLRARDDSTAIGPGKVIARQFESGTPTHDAFTKTGGTIPGIISDTPFSAATNVNSATSGAAQTAHIASFSATQTGHGTDTIAASDTVNAAVIIGIVKTSATTSGGGSASLRRIVGGSTTDSAITVTTSDGLYRSSYFTPSLTDLNAGEAGILHGANTRTQTLEDAWVLADYTPVTAVDGNASGVTVTATASLIDGTASGEATGAGQTLTATASVISGTASGEAQASGQTVTVTASLIEGEEAAEGVASGATVSAPVEIVGGSASGEAQAAGATVTATASVVDGAASGNATAAGGTAQVTASIIAGEAFAGIIADGATITATASTVDGAASGDATTDAQTLVATASLIPGAAGTGVNGTANGADLFVQASIIAGVATGATGEDIVITFGGRSRYELERKDAVAYGKLLVINAILIPGKATSVSLISGRATVDVAAGNDNIRCYSSVISGKAHGEKSFTDEELLLIFSEVA